MKYKPERDHIIRRQFIFLQKRGMSVAKIVEKIKYKTFLTERTITNIVYGKSDQRAPDQSQLSLFEQHDH